MTDLEQIQELNRWPFTEQGICPQCGQWYRLPQLKLPAGSDIEITPEMIAAGREAAGHELVWVTEECPQFSEERLVIDIFRAMALAAKQPCA